MSLSLADRWKKRASHVVAWEPTVGEVGWVVKEVEDAGGGGGTAASPSGMLVTSSPQTRQI